jgi:hypothetical protein
LHAGARLAHNAVVTWKGPLRGRNFRLLLVSNVTSLAGSSVYYVTIPFAVLGIGGSASDVGYVTATRLIPSVALLLVGGGHRRPAAPASGRGGR